MEETSTEELKRMTIKKRKVRKMFNMKKERKFSKKRKGV